MKKIFVVFVLLLPIITEAQVFKKLQVQRLKADTLLLYKVLPQTSDTCLIIKNDTVYWRLCSSVIVDTSVYSYYSDTSWFSYVSDTSNTLQGWDTTSIINYIASMPSPTSYWDSTSSTLHPLDTANAVAIGTNAVAAGTMLRVNDGSVLFDGTTGTTPASGAGTRLMWIPAKAAFRAGVVSGTQWDDANIGLYSSAFGYNTTASGYASNAQGNSTTASGDVSHAEGAATIASGDVSHAEGEATTASGYASHAEGYSTTASGDYSHAEGYITTASGEGSHAEGQYTTASGDASTAMGLETTASGDASTAMGEGTTASGYASTAMGYGTTASGYASTAMGEGTTASGVISTAMGSNTTASGEYSFAHGYNNSVSGIASAVLGGCGIHGTDDSTVYVPNLNIQDTVTIDSLIVNAGNSALSDEGVLAAKAGIVGGGTVYVCSATDVIAWAHFNYKSDGTIYLESSSANVVNTDTDTYFCIYDSGSGFSFKNRLGTKYYVKYTLIY